MAGKPKHRSLFGTLCAWIVDHQLGLSVNLLLGLSAVHLYFPQFRNTTRAFFRLSYYDPTNGAYTQGWDDALFVLFCIVAFTGIRVAVMDYVLGPVAKLVGITKRKTTVRFQEQAWLVIYYGASWSFGMYIMYNSKYWFNLRELWTGFPDRHVSGNLKWYYLVQLAFALQQIIVVNIEEKRNDYAIMFSHHILTSSLIIMSYAYYQTKVGNAILCIADIADVFLGGAKLLRYLGYQTACDIAFGLFLFVWFLTRHVFYLAICWSIHADVPTTMLYGCYDSATGADVSAVNSAWPRDGGNAILANVFQSFLNPGGVVCFNSRIRHGFLTLLLSLQGLILIWSSMMARVVWKVIQGQNADDVRSDSEESDGEVDDVGDLLPATVPVEEEVGVEGLHLGQWKASRGGVRRTAARFRGGRNAMNTTRERKEILGRIGCDGPS